MTGIVSPWILSAQPAKYWKHSAAAGTSIWRDSKIGLPLCSVSSRAISSARSISFSPSFQTSRPRSRADSFAHGPSNAARAAADRGVDVALLGRRHLGDDLFGRRIDDLDRLPARPRRAIRRR